MTIAHVYNEHIMHTRPASPANICKIILILQQKCHKFPCYHHLVGAHEDERTVLHQTKSLDGTKANTNPNTNPNANPIQLFYAFFEHHPPIFSLAHLLFTYNIGQMLTESH